MEHWNDKNAVIRDLERVSRGRLRVDIDPCLTAGKPVTCFGEEETEEEFYRRHCSGDGNFDEPDLESIRKLIFMVKGDEETHEAVQSNGPIQVSKLSVNAPEFKSNDTKSKKNQETYPKPIKEIPKIVDGKNKTARPKRGNVAITSILARQLELIKKESLETKLFKQTETFDQANINKVDAKAKNSPPETSLESKTLKPKLNNQIQLNENNKKAISNLKAQNGFTYPMFSSPSSMFRRKTPKTSPAETAEKVADKTPDIPRRGGAYVPSPHADEYYKKFVQNSEMRKAVTDDLWNRAMAEMKILDEKRKLEEELKMKEKLEKQENEKRNVSDDAASDENLFQYLPGYDFDDSATPESSKASTYTCASALDISGFPDSIQLPQHRHLLTGDCVVCQAEERAAQPKLHTQTTSDTSIDLIEFSESSSQSSTSVELVLEVELFE